MKMVSLTQHVYGGRRFRAGDEFECRGRSDARLLIALKRAEYAVAAVAPAPIKWPEPVAPVVVQEEPPRWPFPTGEVVEAAPEVEPEVEVAPEVAHEPEMPALKPKRAYRRRDMTAEGSE